MSQEKIKLRPCPLCREKEDINVKKISNPTVFWDSAMRGEYGYAVYCPWCGLSVKDEYKQTAIDKWNALYRKGEREKRREEETYTWELSHSDSCIKHIFRTTMKEAVAMTKILHTIDERYTLKSIDDSEFHA